MEIERKDIEITAGRNPIDIVSVVLLGLGLGMGAIPIIIASLLVKENLFLEIWDRMDTFWRSRGWS